MHILKKISFGRHQKCHARSYSYLLTFNLLNFHFPGYAGCLKIFKISLKFHPFLERVTEKKKINKNLSIISVTRYLVLLELM